MRKLAIDGGTPVRTRPFPSGKDIGDEELDLVQQVIQSGQLNRTGGMYVQRFEDAFAEHFGVKHSTASTSGTAAIHVALGALNLEPCDEVITAPITDMGTVIPILAQNCLPVFADVDPETYNITAHTIAQQLTDRTRAVVVVHLFGNPCDMGPIMDLAHERNLWVVEDCSQAHGSMYQGRRVGTIGHLGAFSLQASKHITTGDGGMTITDDDELGERARLFADKGWPRYGAAGARDYLMFGFNYRMTELQGAVGLVQLKKLDRICAARNWAGDLLTEKIKKLKGVIPPKVTPGGVHTYWLYAMRIREEELGMTKERFAEAVRAEGLPCSAGYIGKPIFLYEALRQQRIYGTSHCPFDCPKYGSAHVIRYEEGVCPETERALDEMVTVPISEFLEEEDVEDMATIIAKVAGAE
jgi:perosamine synthetase